MKTAFSKASFKRALGGWKVCQTGVNRPNLAAICIKAAILSEMPRKWLILRLFSIVCGC